MCRGLPAPTVPPPPPALQMEAQIKGTIANDKVVVYSKTYCPYCSNAKALFQKLNVPATVVELDDLRE